MIGSAVAAGYRHIDTAALYGNERGVGRGIREAAIDRSELFVTTKVWNTEHGFDETLRAFDASLDALGLDHVDLYLIHWPAPGQGRYLDSWRALMQLRADGRVRSIGVSNFMEAQLRHLIEATGVTPVLNQVELHPHFQQTPLRAVHAELGIATEAWSPLGRGAVLGEPKIAAIARKHGRSPAQVILAWHLALGIIAIPKSATPARIRENFAVFDIRLDADDMAAIASLDRPDGRTGPDPSLFPG